MNTYPFTFETYRGIFNAISNKTKERFYIYTISDDAPEELFPKDKKFEILGVESDPECRMIYIAENGYPASFDHEQVLPNNEYYQFHIDTTMDEDTFLNYCSTPFHPNYTASEFAERIRQSDLSNTFDEEDLDIIHRIETDLNSIYRKHHLPFILMFTMYNQEKVVKGQNIQAELEIAFMRNPFKMSKVIGAFKAILEKMSQPPQ